MNENKKKNIVHVFETRRSHFHFKWLRLVDKFTYLSSNISSTESDVNILRAKMWTSINWSSIILKSDPFNKFKRYFFQSVAVSVLLYGCTAWTLTKHMEKKLDKNYTRMLGVALNKLWKKHLSSQHLYGHVFPISQTIPERRTRYTRNC